MLKNRLIVSCGIVLAAGLLACHTARRVLATPTRPAAGVIRTRQTRLYQEPLTVIAWGEYVPPVLDSAASSRMRSTVRGRTIRAAGGTAQRLETRSATIMLYQRIPITRALAIKA